jgi:uncharacterized protein YccT (UPF0319 family)
MLGQNQNISLTIGEETREYRLINFDGFRTSRTLKEPVTGDIVTLNIDHNDSANKSRHLVQNIRTRTADGQQHQVIVNVTVQLIGSAFNNEGTVIADDVAFTFKAVTENLERLLLKES